MKYSNGNVNNKKGNDRPVVNGEKAIFRESLVRYFCLLFFWTPKNYTMLEKIKCKTGKTERLRRS